MPVNKRPSFHDSFKALLDNSSKPMWFLLVIWLSLLLCIITLAVILAKYAHPVGAIEGLGLIAGISLWIK